MNNNKCTYSTEVTKGEDDGDDVGGGGRRNASQFAIEIKPLRIVDIIIFFSSSLVSLMGKEIASDGDNMEYYGSVRHPPFLQQNPYSNSLCNGKK